MSKAIATVHTDLQDIINRDRVQMLENVKCLTQRIAALEASSAQLHYEAGQHAMSPDIADLTLRTSILEYNLAALSCSTSSQIEAAKHELMSGLNLAVPLLLGDDVFVTGLFMVLFLYSLYSESGEKWLFDLFLARSLDLERDLRLARSSTRFERFFPLL